jgi:hypothetical protein
MSAVSDLLTSIAACLCAELTPDGQDGPDLCFCGVVAGEGVVADIGFECDDRCGMAWVRLVTAYPAIQIGQFDQSGNTCGAFLGLDVEVGVLRCVEVAEGTDVPDPEDLIAQAVQQNDDMVLIRKAIACCTALDNVDYMLGTYTPIGPEGALGGGAWTLSVLL